MGTTRFFDGLCIRLRWSSPPPSQKIELRLPFEFATTIEIIANLRASVSTAKCVCEVLHLSRETTQSASIKKRKNLLDIVEVHPNYVKKKLASVGRAKLWKQMQSSEESAATTAVDEASAHGMDISDISNAGDSLEKVFGDLLELLGLVPPGPTMLMTAQFQQNHLWTRHWKLPLWTRHWKLPSRARWWLRLQC